MSQVLYSTDASIYKINPLGVFFPEHGDEISAVMEAADKYNVHLVPRGSGSSLAGQAIGPGFVIDFSRHLDKILEINQEEQSAIVEPGVILSGLNSAAGKYGLQFGPDPASDERATIGGIVANNATGAHSIQYGMAADHLLGLEVCLSDGSIVNLSEIDLKEAQRRSAISGREGLLYRAAFDVRENYYQQIVTNWPKTWRRASGYNLNYLLPWSPSYPPHWDAGLDEIREGSAAYPPVKPGGINLGTLIAGSEGTLALMRKIKLHLVPRQPATCLVLLAFPDLVSACDSVTRLLELKPSAVELIPANMIKLAGMIPAYAKQISQLDELAGPDHEFPNLIAVEFSSRESGELKSCAQNTTARVNTPNLVVHDQDLQKKIWNVRKVGLGILMSVPGDLKPIPFIEDLSVPVNKLSEFVGEFEAILAAHSTRGDFYAHASAGCLHMRPLINLKQESGVVQMRQIAQEAISLVSRLGGAPSGEHGDGIARSEWLEKTFGPEIVKAFEQIKFAADPKGLLNPGKIVDPPAMDECLRYGPDYSIQKKDTVLDFSNQGGYAGAVEMCNGAGVCRKFEGVMCPSFQATRDELHSTRGRANLLRTMLTNGLSQEERIAPEDVYQALDLCLACKGCKSECPSAVDMAKLKYEFLEEYYQPASSHRHPMRDYIFGYIDIFSQFGSIVKPVANYMLRSISRFGIGEKWLGISKLRELPVFDDFGTMRAQLKSSGLTSKQGQSHGDQVLFLLDPFTEYYLPEVGLAAWQLLIAAGCKVRLIPVIGSGRTRLSKGFLRAAQEHARKMVAAIDKLDPGQEMAVIGVEPSEIYTLRDEYPDFFPDQLKVRSIAQRAFMLDEYLLRQGMDGVPRILRIDNFSEMKSSQNQTVFLHGHCYQKSQIPAADGHPVGLQASVEILEKVGYSVEVIDAGCCGMAGAFGYEAEHYSVSMDVGELSLFPRIRQTPETALISAAGFSCLSQIKDGTGRRPVHFISLLHDRIMDNKT